jgi:transcriptional regulator with GAF, ATPase, and Fis domain
MHRPLRAFPHRHSRGDTAGTRHYPEYFRALEKGEPIVADDAMKHPSTQEFTSDYLLMNGISAFINSPIHADGELQGVLCIERVGPHSAWTSVQRLFAHASPVWSARPCCSTNCFRRKQNCATPTACDAPCSTVRVTPS